MTETVLLDWYYARAYSVPRIDKVQIRRLGDKTVWTKSGDMRRRIATREGYFPTRHEAAAWILSKLRERLTESEQKAERLDRLITITHEQIDKFEDIANEAPTTTPEDVSNA